MSRSKERNPDTVDCSDYYHAEPSTPVQDVGEARVEINFYCLPFAEWDDTLILSPTDDVISDQKNDLHLLFDVIKDGKRKSANNFTIHWQKSCWSGIFYCIFFPTAKEMDQNLSEDAQRMIMVRNAGGNSTVSEALSFEILKTSFSAKLYKTEMEVSYYPEGGKKIDYICDIFNIRTGVSVARTFKFSDSTFNVLTEEDVKDLILKKMQGIKESSRNSEDKWEGNILHVFVPNEIIWETITKVFTDIPDDIKGKTILLGTITKKSSFIYDDKWTNEELYPLFDSATEDFNPLFLYEMPVMDMNSVRDVIQIIDYLTIIILR